MAVAEGMNSNEYNISVDICSTSNEIHKYLYVIEEDERLQ